jgi:undecaprenyl-diphosphatase
VLKRVVHRTRPPYGTQYLNGTSFSFPSGHAMWSIVGCSMLLYVMLISLGPRAGIRTFLLCVGAVFVILVGASRIYLGVHYPSDVLGGWAVGAAWVAACLSVAGIVLHRRGFALSS